MTVVARGVLEAELAEIAREVVLLAAHVTEGVPAVTEALLASDVDAAQAIIDHDELSHEIEERCYHLLATQQPVAGDLRRIVCALRMVGEIERSGDLVVNIGKALCALHPLELPPVIRGDVTRMGELAAALFRTCVDAYAEADAVLAAGLPEGDDLLDDVHAHFVGAVLAWGEEGNVRAAVRMALVGRYYERIGDHAVNIGERVRYLVEGSLATQGSSARMAERPA